MITPNWCLELILVTLGQELFEPITTCCLEYLTWKATFLLAMTSGRRASELHILCCKPPYIWFTSDGVTIFMRLGFLPKVPSKANICCAIYVPATHNHLDKALCNLCVCRALNEYVALSGRKVPPSSLLLVADGSRANPFLRSGCLAGWSSALNMHMTNMISPSQRGSRATTLARSLSYMLTWLVVTHRPSVRLPLGNPSAHLPNIIGSTLSPTPMPSLAGEF